MPKRYKSILEMRKAERDRKLRAERKKREHQKEVEKRKRARERERERARIRKKKEHEKEVLKRKKQRMLETQKKHTRERLKVRDRKRKRALNAPKRLRRRMDKKAKYKREKRAEAKKARLRAIRESGDKLGKYRIILTLNGYRTETLKSIHLMKSAYAEFDELVRNNRKNVVGHVITNISHSRETRKDLLYEILLVEKVAGGGLGITDIKDEYGKFVKNIVLDDNDIAILDKREWYMEEKYNVHGYDPIRDRKTGKWFVENKILPGLSKKSPKIMYVCKNYVYVHNEADIDFVKCKTNEDSVSLAKDIVEYVANEGVQGLTYRGVVSQEMSGRIRHRFLKEHGIIIDYH